MVYVSKVDGINQIFVMAPDGSNQLQITNLEFSCYYPFYSSDGNRLVFMTLNNEKTVICTVKKDGSEFTQLTDENHENADPHWSPDGKQIVYYSDQDGNDEIYIMNSDGSNKRRITKNGFATMVSNSWTSTRK